MTTGVSVVFSYIVDTLANCHNLETDDWISHVTLFEGF